MRKTFGTTGKSRNDSSLKLRSPLRASGFVATLLEWYRENRRELPWRETTDPYAVLVSEFMLQQTQVDRVAGFYVRFLERFPDLRSLAEADWEEVLECWRGLGYYRRGRNLHAAAGLLLDRHQGQVPADFESLKALPGVGAYTAGAVLSFAFNLPVPALDTNGYRVLSRNFARRPLEDPKRDIPLWNELAQRLIPGQGSRDFHSALMDFGSAVCTAKTPLCEHCPLQAHCQAFQRGEALVSASSPRAPRRTSEQPPTQEVAIAIIRDQGRVLVSRRPEGVHLAGLWEFPGGKREAGESWRACLKREIMEELSIEIAVRPVWRVIPWNYGDRLLHLRFYRCSVLRGTPIGREGQEIRWVEQKRLSDYSFPEANAEVISALLSGK